MPIRGVTCIGCSADRSVVARVDEYVRENMTRVEQTALFKSAALFWRRTVVLPARASGVVVPDWRWKSIRTHYLMHTTSSDFSRIDSLQVLSSMRKTLELSLLTQESPTAPPQLDPKAAELMLKIINLHSKEMSLLSGGGGGTSAGAQGSAGRKL